MPGTYAPPAVELPKTSATVGIASPDSSVSSWKIRPAGTNRSACVGRSAPPDSTRFITGSRLTRAISRARRVLRSEYGFIAPPRTVGSCAMMTHSTPEITPIPVTMVAPTVNAGAPRGERGQLKERAVRVDEQLDPLPDQQAAPVAVPLLVALAAAGDGLLELLAQLVKERELGGPVGAVGLAVQVDMGGEDRHAVSPPRSISSARSARRSSGSCRWRSWAARRRG